MNEYGPETLKDWVFGTRDDGDVGMAHVSAWAADRARIEALEKRLKELRKRRTCGEVHPECDIYHPEGHPLLEEEK